MPVADIKQALFLMDERVLSPELLRQLLAYAPDAAEVNTMKLKQKGLVCRLAIITGLYKAR